MTTAQMQYFLVAAEHLNFTTAAEQLYLSQPSLSRQIAAIETELGVQLFRRSNNVVRLTPAGEALKERLSALYDSYQDIVSDVREIQSGSCGHLTLGILEDQYMNNTIVDAVREVLENNPGCELNIARHSSLSLFSSLTDGTVDAGLMLVYDEFGRCGFESLNLDTSPANLAFNRRLLDIEGPELTVDEVSDILERIPLAMVVRDQFPEQLQGSLLRFVPFTGLRESSKVCFLPDTGTVSLYVGAGLAVTLVNKDNLLANDPNISFFPVKDIGNMTQGLVWRRSCDNPLLTELIESLKKRMG